MFSSCKSTQKKSNVEASEARSELLFSLNTTPCMGPCPVFELKIYADSTLSFTGVDNTEIASLNKKLSGDQFISFSRLINNLEWNKFEKKYESQMSDLPTRKFFYNYNNDSISVYQYSLEPRGLTQLADELPKIVYQLSEK
jgi:hypothetical protein